MITLDDVKLHLRLDLEPDSEQDTQLEAMLAAAMDHVSDYLNRPVPWQDGAGNDVFPAAVRAAVLLIVGDLHENREAVVAGVTLARNPTADRLLHFHRIGLGV